MGTVHTAVYRVPTNAPEADGTLTWNTTMILVSVECGPVTGLDYTYAPATPRQASQTSCSRASSPERTPSTCRE
ncbi:hypothetical protein [Streptomyces flavofungini]|uniref:Uncharacterized protein n=1 Tax=Streptomyces flavofungini TaxID=68200 RepID=A0ABS0XFH9_9ACTN|nr:hypothetical protein [Streptomyces flavofungini]MBJ3811726.1 hypothetical protein [Streptomyces flavofungini]GHC87075.1 hypothetical protein GCM10010349_73460 [Streptomyces flavofungini]